MFNKIDELAVNTIRMLSLDQVESAQSGHPGAPLGQAAMAHVLWTRHLKINPKNPKWFNRDRFVLSSGHASPLLYSLLHLSGFKVSIDDLKNFRSIDSITPGHPEVTHTPGVDATTGPLGQGFANAVGMAMAEAHLSSIYNTDKHNVVDHYTYVICGDGDLQEGVAQEASSLAGHLKLDKLIVLYDSNKVQLDGETEKTFTENIKKKYEAYGWDYQIVEDGRNLDAINDSIVNAKKFKGKPSIIEIKTEIGYGMPSVGTADAHSDPIGIEGMKHARKVYKWLYEEDFFVPEEVYDLYKESILNKGIASEKKWMNLVDSYSQENESLMNDFKLVLSDELPSDWDRHLPSYEVGESESSRDTSGKIINSLSKTLPNFWGGSADLATSNRTFIKEGGDFLPESYFGKNIWYGVREFAMGAILNGITLHGGTKSYVATFLVFSDYLRPAIRVAALSELPNIYIFTHDSVVLGFDGATHEPVEHLTSYRALPNLLTMRPADPYETIGAWEYALNAKSRPTILALSRQGLKVSQSSKKYGRESVKKGAYVISECNNKNCDGILIASGSEVGLSIEAQSKLAERDIYVRVVSVPCLELFEEQPREYKDSVLPRDIKKRLIVEAGSDLSWGKYYDEQEGGTITINTFGKTGSGEEVYKSFGFNVDNIINKFLEL